MRPVVLTPRKSINKAFLKVKPYRMEFETFRNNIIRLSDQVDESESEEFHKNILSEFLKETYYSPNHFINTKGRFDLVIHTGKTQAARLGCYLKPKNLVIKLKCRQRKT